MKYILSFLFFLSSLFAHTTGENHPHFFSTMHIESFTVLIVGFIIVAALYKYIKKEAN